MTLRRSREDESRGMLLGAMMFALGSYTAQEATKGDTWRESSIGELYAHLKHELEEIGGNVRRGEAVFLVHNAVDSLSLSAMLLVRAMEASGMTLSGREVGD